MVARSASAFGGLACDFLLILRPPAARLGDAGFGCFNAGMIETARLTLRLPTLADFEPIHAMRSDPDVVRFVGGKTLSREEAWQRLQRSSGHWSNVVVVGRSTPCAARSARTRRSGHASSPGQGLCGCGIFLSTCSPLPKSSGPISGWVRY